MEMEGCPVSLFFLPRYAVSYFLFHFCYPFFLILFLSFDLLLDLLLLEPVRLFLLAQDTHLMPFMKKAVCLRPDRQISLRHAAVSCHLLSMV